MYVCLCIYMYVLNVCMYALCVDVVDIYMEYSKLNNIGVYKST